jgi:hypothetical protein
MQNVIAWVQNHPSAISALGVAIGDFLWNINPNWVSNGPIHWLYIQMGGTKGIVPVPPGKNP